MSEEEEIHQRYLGLLMKQAALLGEQTPPHVYIEIEDRKREMTKNKTPSANNYSYLNIEHLLEMREILTERIIEIERSYTPANEAEQASRLNKTYASIREINDELISRGHIDGTTMQKQLLEEAPAMPQQQRQNQSHIPLDWHVPTDLEAYRQRVANQMNTESRIWQMEQRLNEKIKAQGDLLSERISSCIRSVDLVAMQLSQLANRIDNLMASGHGQKLTTRNRDE